jgi:carbamoyl-phosphate synthase large subunit
MNRILVTGAGGPAGIAMIRVLVERGGHVVAVDADHLAAGLSLASAPAVVSRASVDPDRFVEELAAIVERHSIDVVISTVAAEMVVLAGREERLGAPVWLHNRRAVAACVDRWRFWKIAEHAHLPVAPCALADRDLEQVVDELPGPWIVKSRFGRGSRALYAVDEPAELAWACHRIEQPIVQRRLSGRPFTVDLLTDRDGRLAGVVPQWRLETKVGISTRSRTFADPRLEVVAAAAVGIYSLTGAANAQGFVTNDDEVVLTELSPRFSGGLSLSLAAGADLVGELVRGTLGEQVRPERLAFRPDVTMVRRYTELYAA